MSPSPNAEGSVNALAHDRRRRGLTLVEVIVTLMICLVLATVFAVGVEASSRVTGYNQRIDQAVDVLEHLRDGIARFNLGERGDTSFMMKIQSAGGVVPGRLSYVTDTLYSTAVGPGPDKNSCNGTFTSIQAAKAVECS